MRHFEGSVLADLYARRDTLEYGRLGRADRGGCALAVVVILKVDDTDDTFAQGVVRLALDVDHAVLMHVEYVAVEVFLHIFIDRADTLAVVVRKIDLRQDDVQRRGLVADGGFNVVPVIGLAGVLVARDDRPGLKILLRQQDIRGVKMLHINQLHCRFLPHDHGIYSGSDRFFYRIP